MSENGQTDASRDIRLSSTVDRLPQNTRLKHLVDAVTNDSFNDWYDERLFTENILEGRPYFNGASPIPATEKHSPSKLLQCHRKVRYYGQNAPQEGDSPQGLFWIGSEFEEEIIVPYLQEAVTTDSTYVRNSLWIDTRVPTSGGDEVRVKGVTDPAIVDSDGDPILVTEIKTTSSLEYLDGPKPHHKAQLHAYMHALNSEFDRSIQDGLLVYGSRDTLDVRAFHIPFDDRFWRENVVEWMAQQTQFRDNGELPPADPMFDWECGTCPFRRRCGEHDGKYRDEGFTGLLPGVTSYRKQQLAEYFDAYPDAKLTPTLAEQHPDLATEHGVYDWECATCGSTFPHNRIDGSEDASPPLCEDCASNGELSDLTVPRPEEQVVGTESRRASER
ncbi:MULTISPECIES: CRISPR-associated protein Cas4 [Haloferacaceae]|uniref:PD-(D/E)XK nuclease family protein n=1 Tax=Halorubrum glutamatedens TaxID=2707018 RepID=A0ABD5QP57_9EURY|nr:PD-(D/E)XK nuclease family protein [Halobellus captivus]